MSRTGVVVFGLLLAAALYDLAVIAFWGVSSSVSQFITDATSISPLQAFVCGALSSHFFGWLMRPTKSGSDTPS